MDLPCCQNDTSSFFQFSHIISPFFFSPQSSSLSTLLEIDEQRRFGNKSDAKTPTRGGSLSTGGGGGFFCVVRS